ncbi:Mitochondrial distribution and morphology protein 31, mitochondrial precursor [Malassezia vespertilionis]|uniref:Mitochondrial distribution and morphology protein 31, mitochondrial precursor n=1 Tax=Malassezia vespertilionis TaxID=2020962 RepID=UPI0024B12E09|nr:Mitochondrial distribution and morphology protein 31, mitochondrial precursor [Malassezia vespertilionis]WFD07130.1 Mitochondrial distribution and morphology protein 31, mitochondrial precursor [Malassezia vespertilionis]
MHTTHNTKTREKQLPKEGEQRQEAPLDSAQEPNTALQKSPMTHELVEMPPKTLFQNYPRSLRNLALKARSFALSRAKDKSTGKTEGKDTTPTQEDMLGLARGFWTRLRIRFKWFTIRSYRRFNIDEISAFFTLGGLGTAIWVIVGTTTFVSVIFAALNLLNLQEWIALQIAKYISRQTGFTVACNGAIVPKWKEGRISFKDVVVTRQATPIAPEELQQKTQDQRPTDAQDNSPNNLLLWEHIPAYDTGKEFVPPLDGDEKSQTPEARQPDKNFSMFELQIDSVDVQLSLSRWLDGHGMINTANMHGVRGIVDRRNVFWDPNLVYDPRATRRKARPGDFDLQMFTVEDFLVTLYQPGDFRPFNVSIFSARIPRLRTQWLFYDLLNAESITGQIDGCLFSLHKPQSVQHTSSYLYGKGNRHYFQNWSRLRVDGANIDHIQKMSGLSGPMTWIYSGRFDLVADIKFPRQYDKDVDINTVFSEILENLGATFSHEPLNRYKGDELIPGQPVLSEPAIVAPIAAVGPVSQRAQQQRVEHDQAGQGRIRRSQRLLHEQQNKNAEKEAQATLPMPGEGDDGVPSPPQSVLIELDLRFKDIKASMPIFTRELSYSSYAFARPIVAFMNSKKTLIPVRCRIVMDLSEFDGSLDLAQTGLLPLVSDKIYEAFANHVRSQQANSLRMRNVSIWSLDLAAHGLLRMARHLRDSFARVLPTLEAQFS